MIAAAGRSWRDLPLAEERAIEAWRLDYERRFPEEPSHLAERSLIRALRRGVAFDLAALRLTHLAEERERAYGHDTGAERR
jgi:hypothetical protein